MACATLLGPEYNPSVSGSQESGSLNEMVARPPVSSADYNTVD